MKKIITLLALTLSVGLLKAATSQDTIIMRSQTVVIGSEGDTLRTKEMGRNIFIQTVNGQKWVYKDVTRNGDKFTLKDVESGDIRLSRGVILTSLNWENRHGKKRWRWASGHWMGVSIFYSGLVQNLGHLSMPQGAEILKLSPKSIGVDLNFIDAVIVSKGCFGLVTGLGLEINNFRFDNNVGLTTDENGVVIPNLSYTEQGIYLTKSKLNTVYLNMPLLFEFQFGRPSYRRTNNNIFINFGVIGGLRIHSHTKVKSNDDRMNGTFKEHGGLNLRNFHYGFIVNVGYGNFALSAKYYPHSIFTNGGGPNLQQVNIGLSILF